MHLRPRNNLRLRFYHLLYPLAPASSKVHYAPATTFLFLLTTILTAQEIVVWVSAHEGTPTISCHIYGHFAEHLGRCTYGGFYVGEGRQIPNTAGVRMDVVEALRGLKIPTSAGPAAALRILTTGRAELALRKRLPFHTQRWGSVKEDNSFGTHDHLNKCEFLKTIPHHSANVGSGTV